MARQGLFWTLLSAACTAVLAKTVPGAYIVEFEDGQDTSAFYNKVAGDASTRMKLDFQLFKGASIQFHDHETASSQAAAVNELPVVKSIWPVQTYSLPKPQVVWTGNPKSDYSQLSKRSTNTGTDTFSTHVMTQVDKLRALGYTGKGVKIAEVDTGIDYKHPALGGCFGKGCLVSFGTDLVGDAYTGFNTPVPDPDPMDCAGHGTHVAGIIAAQNNTFGFTGAAPDVTLGAYRVFGCDGQAGNDVLIAAFNMAYEAGANIITASIGGTSGWSEDPWAVAVSRIVDAGVPCTLAAGNDGADGQFYASTAANGKRVTAVASVDNVVTPLLLTEDSYTVDGGSPVTFGYTAGSPDAWAGVQLPLWTDSFDTTNPSDGCAPYPDSTPDLSGYIVLIRRGSCLFVNKATNAAAKGAKYIMLYNNVAGAFAVDVSAVSGIAAIGMTTPDVGAAWVADLKAGKKVVLQMTDPLATPLQLTVLNNTASGGFMSTYTSWGPTWELDIKPQVGAPGGNILSTWPTDLGSYAILSGTSMATPCLAGILALVGQARKTFDPNVLTSLLSTTANPNLFNDGKTTYSYPAPVSQQGGGLVQAYDAATTPHILSTSSLAYNDTDHFFGAKIFTIKNTGKKDVTFKLGHVAAATAYTLVAGSIFPDTFPNEMVTTHASLAIIPPVVYVPAGWTVPVSVIATPPSGLDASRLPVWSGWVTLNGTDGSSLSLPYQGVTGSMARSTVLNSTYLSTTADPKLGPVSGGNLTFVLPKIGSDPSLAANMTLPVAIVNLALGSPLVRCDVVPLAAQAPKGTTTVLGTKTIGQVAGFPATWSPRGMDVIEGAWNGSLADGSYAPAGQYKLAVKALHIFGNKNDVRSYDAGESVPFTISYGK